MTSKAEAVVIRYIQKVPCSKIGLGVGWVNHEIQKIFGGPICIALGGNVWFPDVKF